LFYEIYISWLNFSCLYVEKEQRKTFISLFDLVCQLIGDISLYENTIAFDTTFNPRHAGYLVLGYDSKEIQIFNSFTLKPKSRKKKTNFGFKNFVIPEFS
jgi:hypothetical protein